MEKHDSPIAESKWVLNNGDDDGDHDDGDGMEGFCFLPNANLRIYTCNLDNNTHIIIPLHWWRRHLREIEWFTQGHTARKW